MTSSHRGACEPNAPRKEPPSETSEHPSGEGLEPREDISIIRNGAQFRTSQSLSQGAELRVAWPDFLPPSSLPSFSPSLSLWTLPSCQRCCTSVCCHVASSPQLCPSSHSDSAVSRDPQQWVSRLWASGRQRPCPCRLYSPGTDTVLDTE